MENIYINKLRPHGRLISGRESAAWSRGLKRRFYGDRVITIARFNSHPHRARCCVLG